MNECPLCRGACARGSTASPLWVQGLSAAALAGAAPHLLPACPHKPLTWDEPLDHQGIWDGEKMLLSL